MQFRARGMEIQGMFILRPTQSSCLAETGFDLVKHLQMCVPLCTCLFIQVGSLRPVSV